MRRASYVERLVVEDLFQRFLGSECGTGVAGHPRLPQQRIREPHSRARVIGMVAQPPLISWIVD